MKQFLVNAKTHSHRGSRRNVEHDREMQMEKLLANVKPSHCVSGRKVKGVERRHKIALGED